MMERFAGAVLVAVVLITTAPAAAQQVRAGIPDESIGLRFVPVTDRGILDLRLPQGARHVQAVGVSSTRSAPTRVSLFVDGLEGTATDVVAWSDVHPKVIDFTPTDSIMERGAELLIHVPKDAPLGVREAVLVIEHRSPGPGLALASRVALLVRITVVEPTAPGWVWWLVVGLSLPLALLVRRWFRDERRNNNSNLKKSVRHYEMTGVK